MHIIQRNCGTDIRLPDVASKVHLSYVQFARRFRQATGLTPFEYMTAIRIEKAKQLLSDTHLTLHQIAVECGFDNQYYFSSFFKKHCGMSPSEFRKNLL